MTRKACSKACCFVAGKIQERGFTGVGRLLCRCRVAASKRIGVCRSDLKPNLRRFLARRSVGLDVLLRVDEFVQDFK